MMKEIGSEFCDVPTTEYNNVFFNNANWFLSGRGALKAIINEVRPKSIALPSWCCETMIRPFVSAGISTEFYLVDGKRQEIANVSADALLIMDYFGYTNCSHVPPDYSGTVIRDVTHSFFSINHNDADYYYGSLRKWAGFWTGGFALGLKSNPFYESDDKGYTDLRERAMCEKAKYLCGLVGTKDYLKTFYEAEKLLDRLGVLPAAARDITAAEHIDWRRMKEQRRKNAEILLESFSEIAIFPCLEKEDCPLFVPIMVPDGKRDDLHRFLVSQDIYCPVHWPVSELHHLTYEAKRIYDNELSIICDQRYTETDMERICTAISCFLGQG